MRVIKIPFLFKAVIAFIFLISAGNKANATHIFGGELYYTHVAGNSYTLNLTLYGDCGAQASVFNLLYSATPQIQVYNNASLFTTINLTALPNTGQEVTPVCPNQTNNTTCVNPAGAVPGVRKFQYAATVTLNAQSTNWRFLFTGELNNSQAGRSNNITNIQVGSRMAFEATLNNTVGANNSPSYTTIPTPFFCINKPAEYNQGAVDPDAGDVLVFSLIPGIDGGIVGNPPVTYIAPYTAVAPLATAPATFNFNSLTGQLSFTPNLVQRALVVCKVEEYRNNVLVGTSVREMTIVVLNNCNNNPPTGSITGVVGGTQLSGSAVTVCQNSGVLNFNFTVTDPDLNNITVTATGVPAGATLTITNNNTASPSIAFSWNVANVPPGVYNFFLTFQDDGCPLSSKQTLAYTITVLPRPNFTFALVDPGHCMMKPKFSITASNNIAPYILSVYQGATLIHTINPMTNPQIDSLVPGTYTIRVTGGNNCYYDSNVVIPNPPTIIPLILSLTPPTCHNGNDATVTLQGSNTTAPYTYSLGTGPYSSTNVFTGLTPGPKLFHIKDVFGCIKDTLLTIPNTPPITANITFTKPPCNFYQSGEIIAVASGGTAPYQYALGTGPFQSSGTFSGLYSGPYVLHIKDTNNCTLDTNIVLPDSIKVHANAVVTDVSCYGGNDGAITITAYGATAPYQYALLPNAPSAVNVFTGLTAGTKSFHITDANNCYLDTNVIVNQPDSMTIALTLVQNTCMNANNGSVTAAVTGGTSPYQYSLNSGPYQMANSFTALAAGVYTLTVKDAHDCLKSVNFTITQPDSVFIDSFAMKEPTCFGGNDGSIYIQGGGGTPGYTYSINSSPFQAANLFSGLNANTYTLVVKDNNGCLVDTSVVLNQPPDMFPSISILNPICATLGNGTIIINSVTNGTPGYQFSLNSGPYQSANSFYPVPAGTHLITVKDTNNCTKDTMVTLIDTIVVGINVNITDALCYGDSNGVIVVTGSNGISPYTYQLNFNPWQTNNTFSGLPANVYFVGVKDSNGCIHDTVVFVDQPDYLEGIFSFTMPLCYGDSNGVISILPIGGTPTYQVSMNGGPFTANLTYSNLPTGNYNFQITDNHNCHYDTTVTLLQPTKLGFTAKQDSVRCFGESNGSITVTATGATPGYTYAVNTSPYQTSNVLTGLPAGWHTVYVKDANGCIKDSLVEVKQPDKLRIDHMNIDSPTCEGYPDGAVQLFALGGNPPYKYSKDGVTFQTSTSFSRLQEGIYTFYVEDGKGCKFDTTINLVGYPHILIDSIAIKNVSCFGFADGKATAHVRGGNPRLQYQVKGRTPFSYNPIMDSLKAGTYTLVIKDSTGCIKTQDFTLTQPDKLIVKDNVVLNDCEGSDNGGAVTLQVTGGTQPYKYYWNTTPPQYIANIANLQNGTYDVLVSDAQGCKDTVSVEVSFGNCCKPFIPDAFTPNGDGLNDVYRLRWKGDMAIVHFYIFNRWGEKVFQTVNPNDGWDGTFRGKPQDMGTFNYYIKMKCGDLGDKELEFKGTLSLIR